MARRLVVDTSIARAAGTKEHPTSINCRAFLQAMLDTGHKVVITDSILREWTEHKSGYSTTWLAAMIGKRRVLKVSEDPARRMLFLARLYSGSIDPPQRKAIEKDAFLILAAWEADEIVSSCDERVRRMLATHIGELGEDVGRIVWVNPNVPAEDVVPWLKAGARTEEARKLRRYLAT
jgi:hypothetical protein